MARLNGLWWWIDRWRKSTAFMDMTLEEQGAYRNLLDEAHLRGGALPNDERILAKACGDALAWPRVRERVLARLARREETRLIVSRYRRLPPLVVRFHRRHIPLAIRRLVFERDGFACVFCAAEARLSLDHIRAFADGGPDTVENLRVLCMPCNRRRGRA